MTQYQSSITGTTHTLPFDRLSPRDFERLCLWLVEREGYERAEHLGAAGSEQGRDIVAWRDGALWAFQCKRVRRFGPKDALAEVEKVLALPEDQRPAEYVFIVTCDVSANTRQQVRQRCNGKMKCHFWAGTELDEKVKRHSDILEEFFQVDQGSTTVVGDSKVVDHRKTIQAALVIVVVLAVAATGIWLFWLTPEPPLLIVEQVVIEIDEIVVDEDACQEVVCDFCHRIEVKVLGFAGVPIQPDTFSYNWRFNPSDPHNKDKFDSTNYVINYCVPCERNSQTVTVEVLRDGAPLYVTNLRFNIKKQP